MMEFYRHTYPKARKEYNCECCNGMIHKGEKYSCESGKYDGDMLTRRLCLTCKNITEEFLTETGYDDFDWWNVTDWLHDKYCSPCENCDYADCDFVEVACPVIREHFKPKDPDITAQEP